MTTTREAAAVEAQIREIEAAMEQLLARLKPGIPNQQRVSLERMIAKKQSTLRRLQGRHSALVRQRPASP
ncbi:MAG: hypothetical protein ACT4QG_10290 [Sporichthyaceae bacterium]